MDIRVEMSNQFDLTFKNTTSLFCSINFSQIIELSQVDFRA